MGPFVFRRQTHMGQGGWALYNIETFGPVTGGRGYASAAVMQLRVYVYYVDGLLVDTGPRRLARGFHRFMSAVPKVEQVVLTHLHEDHCGMASLPAGAGVPVYCHPDFAAATTRRVSLPFYRAAFWRRPAPFLARPLPSRIETGQHSFQIIPTPGHAVDHVVFHEPEQGWLFSGDLFLGSRVLTIMRDESLPKLMTSIRRVLELDFDTMFCGHAGQVADGKTALRDKLQNMTELEGLVRTLAEKGCTVREATKRIFPKFQLLTLLSGGEYSPENVVRSLWPS